MARDFRIALGMLLSADDMRRLNVDVNVLNDIQATIWHQLIKVLPRSPLVGSMPDIAWDYTKKDITDLDLVVYFVATPNDSVIKRLNLPNRPTNAAGVTALAHPVHGTISEVYVENNFPAEKLGKIAFHELMHNKLQIDDSMHSIPGMGMGQAPVAVCSKLTDTDIRKMAARLKSPVKQYADDLPGDVATKFFIKPVASGVKMVCT